MPEKSTIRRARQDKREGKAASTQAGEFVHEEIEHIREGKHGARSTKQAIAIGLSKARRAGVDLPPPEKGEASEETRRKAKRDIEAGVGRKRASKKTAAKKAAPRKAASKKTAARKTSARKSATRKSASKRATPSKTRSRATTKALKREGRAAASPLALARQAKSAARKRTASERSAAAKKAARTKGAEGRSEAARKAARTRTKHNGAAAHA